MSTTTESDVALSFNSGAFGRPYFERVLFQIEFENKIDKQLKIPFANIQNVSYNQDEREVLFGMGSVFRIIDVDALTDDLWLVQLMLIEQNGVDETLREYFLAKHVGEKSTLLVMSSFLDYMGEYNRAKHFCELLLNEDSISNDVKMQAYSDLGYYQYQLGDLVSAESSANLALQLQSASNCFAPATYSLLGLIAGARHDYRSALRFHQVAVDTVRSRRLEENEGVAGLYVNLGMAWKDLCQAIPALYWCEQIALPCQLKLLPPSHPDLLTTFGNIAEIYNSIGNYAKARTYYERSLEIQKQILPQNHKDVASTLQGLFLVCQQMGEYEDALGYLQQEQEIILYSSSHNHIDLVPSYLGLAVIYELLIKDKKSLFYYRKACRALSANNSEHRMQLATAWNNMGFLYLQNKRYKIAIIYFFKALSLERKFLPVRAPLVLTTLSNIGMVYEGVGLLKKAWFYHRYVLKKRKIYLRPRDPGLATTWDNIGVVLRKIGQYKKAIEYHQRALTSYVLSLPPDHLITSCVCEHLGDVYRLLGKKQKARQYYNKPEQMARAHLREVEKYRNKEAESDEDLIIRKEEKLALLIDENAFAYSTMDQSSLQTNLDELH
jgi:tetratricopeptide (TPR) repeat protein